MTVSSPEFDLIFGRISAKEERIDKLDRKIARKELRLAGITDDSKQAARLEAKVDSLQAKKDATAASIETLDALLPKDEVTLKPEFFFDPLTGDLDYLQFEVTIQDSPYDDTLEFPTGLERGLAYSTNGNGDGGNWYRTVGTSDRPQADSVFTATRGSETMGQQWLYGDTFTFSIYDNFGTKEEEFADKELLFTQTFNTEIV